MLTKIRQGKKQYDIYIKVPKDLSINDKQKICDKLYKKLNLSIMDVTFDFVSEYCPRLENKEVIRLICE